MRYLLGAALITGLAMQASEALAYACNNRYYVNVSGHVVHSPSCGNEHLRPSADCRDGSISLQLVRRIRITRLLCLQCRLSFGDTLKASKLVTK
jgi:hypothetical protein